MKILHVITSLETGGAEHLLVDLLPRLRDLNNEVELAVFKSQRTPFYNELERAGIKIHGFSLDDGYYNIKHYFRLRRLMRRFDIIHTHNTSCQIYAAFAKSSKNILITTEHSTSTRRRNYRFFRYIDRWMYNRYDKIICISKPSEISLRRYIGEKFPIITIHNGIDISRFANAERIDLGLPNCKVITMVAGFRYEKDQSTAIKAMNFLPSDYHLLLVGDGEKRPELEKIIADNQLSDRVHLLGLRNDVPQILKSSDVILMSSHREGLSLSNVEGMSSGNPFIASDVEGLREVTEGYGVLFPHGDYKTLAHEIHRLIVDSAYRLDIVNKCTARASQYDINFMVQNYNQVYDEYKKTELR